MKRFSGILLVFFLLYASILKGTDCYSSRIEEVDSCLIGMTLKAAINKLQVNANQYNVLQGGDGIQGYHINLPDYIIDLYILPVPVLFKVVIGSKEDYVDDRQIISLQWKSKITGQLHTIYK